MNVWIVLRAVDWDPQEIQAVFATEEAARAYVEANPMKYEYVYYDIEEWPVDQKDPSRKATLSLEDIASDND